MDLRPYSPTRAQLELAADLACRGLLCYQPFIFSEDLQTGAGYEFAKGAEGAGLVYCANPPEQFRGNASVERHLIDPAIRGDFAAFNQRLRVLYDTMIDMVGEHVGPIPGLTMADVGCCSGYFPVSFAKRGAKKAVGFDLVDYTPTFGLLNDILGTKAEFRHKGYSGAKQGVDEAEQFDVVFSIAVLVHLSDPLHHLAFLGRMAKKAIVVWTSTSKDPEEDLAIRYKSINRYYEHAQFPFCFDFIQISPGLLRRSLELMGFTEIYPIPNRPEGMPPGFFSWHRGYVAVRPDKLETKDAAPGRQDAQEGFGLSDSIPRLMRTVRDFNIVSLRGRYWGVPHALGPMDLTHVNVAALPGVIGDTSPDEVEKKILALYEGKS